jgi:hypothetical protein
MHLGKKRQALAQKHTLKAFESLVWGDHAEDRFWPPRALHQLAGHNPSLPFACLRRGTQSGNSIRQVDAGGVILAFATAAAWMSMQGSS